MTLSSSSSSSSLAIATPRSYPYMLVLFAFLTIVQLNFLTEFSGTGRFLRATTATIKRRDKVDLPNETVIDNDKEQQQQQDHYHNATSLAIVTAMSENHLLEGLSMLKSLVRVGYAGPVYIYLMRRRLDEAETNDDLRAQLQQQLDQSPLDGRVVEYVESQEYSTYCFKPKVIAKCLQDNDIAARYGMFMWTDTSTRFLENPTLFGQRMQRAKLDMVGRVDAMGMGENTHELMYQYFGLQRDDYKEYAEIAGTHFLMNVRQVALVKHVLEPWIECASEQKCQVCMAPKGSRKKEKNGLQYKGPPHDVYVGHRQDQSALGLLTYKYIKEGKGAVHAANYGYHLNITTDRHKDNGIRSIKDFHVV